MGQRCGCVFDVRVLRAFRSQIEVNHHMKPSRLLGFLLGICVLSSRPALACTVCMGANGSAIGEAANGAIFVMLGVLALVLGLIVVAGYSVVRRGRLPVPPHAELLRSMTNSEAN